MSADQTAKTDTPLHAAKSGTDAAMQPAKAPTDAAGAPAAKSPGAQPALTQTQTDAIAAIHSHKAGFIATLDAFPGECSREMSIALTKMEEAVMWAVKHVTG